VGPLQELEDVLLEVGARIDFSLVQERASASGFDLASDLFRDPSV
jgi:hypothetical protein